MLRYCRFSLALALFVFINVALATNMRQLPFIDRAVREKGIVHQAADSAVEEYQNLPSPPSTVLMGSSIMMSPLWSCDILAFPKTQDIYHHHVSYCVNSILSQHGNNRTSFSFALPGAMVSDIYLITKKLFTGAKCPSFIVYGISPRDFMDNLLTGETRTPIFKRLSDLRDVIEDGDFYLGSWTEQADFVMNNAIFLYGKRCRYQDKLNGFIKQLIARLNHGQLSESSPEVGFAFVQPIENSRLMWQRSIEEYRNRYSRFDSKQFDKQCVFLERMLLTAKQRGIKVLLINMPVSRQHLKLMPTGLYDRYVSFASTLATRYSATFLNLQDCTRYGDRCFYDTIHLNSIGGKKFLSDLAGHIEHDSDEIHL